VDLAGGQTLNLIGKQSRYLAGGETIELCCSAW
jgi:hypothetical protein